MSATMSLSTAKTSLPGGASGAGKAAVRRGGRPAATPAFAQQRQQRQQQQRTAVPALPRGKRQAPSSSGRRHSVLVAATDTDEADVVVDGAISDFCNDDVCTASPAVEQTVRSLATDITMHRWSERLFQLDCSYNDKFRSFKGRDKYQRLNFVKDNVEDPSATIMAVKMTDKSHSWIQWKLTGKIAGQVVEVEFTDEFEHNQVTGRVSEHKEIWHALAGGMLFNTQRATWSATQASSDTKEMIDRTLDSLSMDEGDDEIYRDPSDPTKFFQKGEDEGFQDMIAYATVIAVLWLIFQGYSALNTM